jgi:Txe/YoeB family toxin of Txe-Axe toxin-antitoxin module
MSLRTSKKKWQKYNKHKQLHEGSAVMESNDSVVAGGLLVKLTRLEDQVSTLSKELESSKNTISLLKLSLTERDSQIYELESKLTAAQNTQLKTTVNWIERCRHQIQSGVDEKFINPTFAKIRQRIEIMQRLVYETKDLVNQKVTVIQANIHNHSALIKQWPEQARLYFEQGVVEPLNSLINETVASTYSYLKAIRDLTEQKILYPCKVVYDEAVVAVLALPSQSRIILQVWLIDPARQQMAILPELGLKLSSSALAWLSKSINQLRALIDRVAETIGNAIKNSSFWNGNQPIQTA